MIICSFSDKNPGVCQQLLEPHTGHPVQCDHKIPAKEHEDQASAS